MYYTDRKEKAMKQESYPAKPESCLSKLKRRWRNPWCRLWHVKVKLRWNRLWIRKDEFHPSLNSDFRIMLGMTKEEREAYQLDLVKRRDIAHRRDIENIDSTKTAS